MPAHVAVYSRPFWIPTCGPQPATKNRLDTNNIRTLLALTILFSINQETFFAPAIEIPFACVFPITPFFHAYVLRRKFSDPGTTISVVVCFAMSGTYVVGLHAPIVVGCTIVRLEGRVEPRIENVTKRRIFVPRTNGIVLIHRVAIHEAGHLLSALLSPLPTPLGVWVTARGGRVEPAPLATMTSRLAKAKLRMCLAGREAETLVLSEVSNGAGVGPASDLAQATVLATQMELNWSFGESGLAWQDVSQMDFRKLPLKTQQRIEAHLQEAETAVRALDRKSVV